MVESVLLLIVEDTQEGFPRVFVCSYRICVRVGSVHLRMARVTNPDTKKLDYLKFLIKDTHLSVHL